MTITKTIGEGFYSEKRSKFLAFAHHVESQAQIREILSVYRKKYYDAMRAGMDVKTGLISSGDFENCFRSIMERNEDVLYFSLSKNISGTFNSARLAAETLMENPPCC